MVKSKTRRPNNNRKLSSALLTVGDVASLLNLHQNTVRRWADKGVLQTIRIGPRRDRRFRRADIERLLAGGQLPP